MDNIKRTIVNTLAQHLKTVVNVLLSLYSTRLVLCALGQSDFGLFSLVGGIVLMLGFITNAMAVATQRHLSFYQGKGDLLYVKKIFVNSLLLHVVLGIAVSIVLLALTNVLFDGFLNIDSQRVDAGRVVYYLMVANLLLGFLSTPYRASFIARENIVYVSLVDVLDGVLKLLIAILLLHVQTDKLILYAILMTCISAVNLMAFSVYATHKFSECRFHFNEFRFDNSTQKLLMGFTGWTIYSTGCILGRNQGAAVLLNTFFGTVINSAYGIAMQVSTAVLFLSQAVINALSPQVIKAEGRHERQHMLSLSEYASKYSFLLLSLVCIPLLMQPILQFWLGQIPPYAVAFCQLIIISSLCDQLTVGLGIANQAIGRIRNYSLVINTTKLLTLPIAWLILKATRNPIDMMTVYVIIEFVCAMARVIFLKITAELSIMHYAKAVFMKVLLPIILMTCFCWWFTCVVDMQYRFLLTITCSCLIGAVAIYTLATNKHERELILSVLHH